MKNRLTHLFATFFYAGYFRYSPGTCASLFAVFMWFFIPQKWFFYKVAATVFMFIGGVYSAGQIEKKAGEKDPSIVVIDEITGMWATLSMLPYLKFPQNYLTIAITFVLFRFFDITKFPPIKKLENIGGGFGIMSDDLLAGLYTAVVINLVRLVS